ncbi:MAG: diacylglycerol kinase family protein [Verrucomicrobiota bacterium]
MSKTLVIFNPSARGERAGAMQEQVSRLVGDAVVRMTTELGKARALAATAAKEGFTTVVAAGGDGTINEVVNGLGESDLTLGILPIGTMNVFATELALPAGHLEKCWEIIRNGHVRNIDLPMAGDRYFVQLAGIGLDAQAVQETSPDLKRTIGPLSYLISLAQIAARKPPRMTIQYDGGSLQGSFVLIGNGRFYGGPFVVFKNAKIDDGLLDVIVCKNIGYLDVIRYMHAALFGEHINQPDVEYFQTRSVSVSSEEPVPVEVDGDVIGNLPLTFGFSPHKLRVLAP